MATWNLLHLGNDSWGPDDDTLQIRRVRDVILGTDADLWAVQEVTRAWAFRELLDSLPGYDGVLASDSIVESGFDYYHISELKVGLVYKPTVVAVHDASLILTDLNHEFAGRPPLQVRARVTTNGAEVDAVFIILHAKAMPDTASWKRRAAASAGLERHLANRHSDAVAFVLGDFNDDIDESIAPGLDTPYRNLLDAAPEWEFATMSLTEAGETSILGYGDMIDHILVSDEAWAQYEEGSAQVYRVDDHIPQYRDNTSDHLPVVARFTLRQPEPGVIATLFRCLFAPPHSQPPSRSRRTVQLSPHKSPA